MSSSALWTRLRPRKRSANARASATSSAVAGVQTAGVDVDRTFVGTPPQRFELREPRFSGGRPVAKRANWPLSCLRGRPSGWSSGNPAQEGSEPDVQRSDDQCRRAAENCREPRRAAKLLVSMGFDGRRSNAKSSHLCLLRHASHFARKPPIDSRLCNSDAVRLSGSAEDRLPTTRSPGRTSCVQAIASSATSVPVRTLTPFRRSPPCPGRRRCTWSPGRIERSGVAFRA